MADDVMDELREIGHYQRELPQRRAEVVSRARAEGHTWRSIAEALGMTQNAVIAANQAFQAKRSPQK